MTDEGEKPPPKQNPLTVAPNAAIILLVEMLTELKESGGAMSYESLERRLEKIGESSLGQSNPESMEFIKVILAEVRTRSA